MWTKSHRTGTRISPRTMWPRPESHTDIPAGREKFLPLSPGSFTVSLSKKTNFLHCRNAAILLALAQRHWQGGVMWHCGHVRPIFLPVIQIPSPEIFCLMNLIKSPRSLKWFLIRQEVRGRLKCLEIQLTVRSEFSCLRIIFLMVFAVNFVCIYFCPENSNKIFVSNFYLFIYFTILSFYFFFHFYLFIYWIFLNSLLALVFIIYNL